MATAFGSHRNSAFSLRMVSRRRSKYGTPKLVILAIWLAPVGSLVSIPTFHMYCFRRVPESIFTPPPSLFIHSAVSMYPKMSGFQA